MIYNYKNINSFQCETLNKNIEFFKFKEQKLVKIYNKSLYSKFNNQKYIARYFKEVDNNTETIILIGGGLGYHLDYININFSNIKIIVIEVLPEFISYYIDRIEKNKNIKIMTYSDYSEIESDLTQLFNYTDLTNLKIINIYKSISELNNITIKIIKIISEFIDCLHKNFWTYQNTEKLWNENISKNFKWISKSIPINRLYRKYKNVPALIVGAGPSLDNDLEKIKEVKDYFLIISVDTALASLIKNNIVPDYVLSIDAKIENYKYFTNIKNEDFVLVYDIITNYNILPKCKNNKKVIAVSGRHLKKGKEEYLDFIPLWSIIQNYVEDIGHLQTGGSVSTNALDFARVLECDPIIFIGQDLSYSKNKFHCSDSYDEVNRFNSLNKFNSFDTIFYSNISEKQLFPVKGTNNETVYTDLIFKHYINWLGNSCAIMNQKCINATSEGAIIPNTETMSFSEVINKYKKNKFDTQIINKIKEKKIIIKPELFVYIEKLKNKIIEIKNIISDIENNKNSFDNKAKKEYVYNELSKLSIFKIYIDKYLWDASKIKTYDLSDEDKKRLEIELWIINFKQAVKEVLPIFNEFFNE